MRQRVIGLLSEFGTRYLSEGLVRGFELHEGHDIHLYLLSAADWSNVIHVQGYPGMSNRSSEGARINARRMNYEKLQTERQRGVSVGNEHEAVTQVLPEFNSGVGTFVDWKGDEIGRKLKPYLIRKTD